MRQPIYQREFTLKDYIAGLVRKDGVSTSSSTRDYIKALDNYESEAKSYRSSLSAEAKSFVPIKPVYILVSSLNSNISYSIPVLSDFLPLSILHQFFPLATSMHYFDNGQMITLATAKNYNTGTEFSQLEFCIPDSCHQYFVSEHDEVDRNDHYETFVEDAVMCVEGIEHKLSSTMAQVEKLMEEVIGLQKLLKDQQIARTILKMNNEVSLPNYEYVCDMSQNLLEAEDTYYGDYVENSNACSEHTLVKKYNLDPKESELKYVFTEASSLEMEKDLLDKNKVGVSDNLEAGDKKYVDDYGFSDTDIDDEIDVFSVKSVDCKVEKVDIKCYVNDGQKRNRSSSPRKEVSDLPLKSESFSFSCRPKCVRRVDGWNGNY